MSELIRQAPGLTSSPQARAEFVAQLRTILPEPAEVADDDPIPEALRSGDVQELLSRAAEAEADVDGGRDLGPEVCPCARSASCRARSATAVSLPRAQTVREARSAGSWKAATCADRSSSPTRTTTVRSDSRTPSRPGSPVGPRPDLGDASDPYGGIGANGALGVADAEQRTLGDENARYGFTAGRLY